MNNQVHALTVFDDGSGGGPALYAGGSFTIAGGVVANFVARWDGSAWSPLGSGMNNQVHALTVFDDGSGGGPALYPGGSFTIAGGVVANFVARWDGSAWSPLGSGMNNPVHALIVFDDGSGGGPALYAGGGGVVANFVARWDGSAWSPLGSGMSNQVRALTVFDDDSGGGPALYAGGLFTSAGGVAANHIARWDGSAWSPLGTGMNDWVFALTVFDDGSGGGPALYAGGDFTSAGGVAANRIARWDGSAWSPLGSGMNNRILALTVFDDDSGGEPALYAGGTFTASPGGDSFIARWGCGVPSPSTAVEHASPRHGRWSHTVRTPTFTVQRPGEHLLLQPGQVLTVGDETVRYASLFAMAGSIVRLEHPNAVLHLIDATFEPGAILEWEAGTIEIESGRWSHPDEIVIGCIGQATLRLVDGGLVQAPSVRICDLGEVAGHGTVEAPTLNGGRVAPAAGGISVQGPYVQEPAGELLVAVADEVGASPSLGVVEGAILAGRLLVEGDADEAIDCLDGLSVLTAAKISGGFSGLEFAAAACRPALRALYEPTVVSLSVGPAAVSPDVDCDGVVTVGDLVAVLRSWGACPSEGCCLRDIAPADGGDGIVNGLDLLEVLTALEGDPP